MNGCASPTGGQRIDNIPMYGQPEITRPDFLKKADEDFIAKASGGFGGDRKAASDAWIAQADKYMREENLDYAMRRYNQAWLLNPDSYKPYWGFARVAARASLGSNARGATFSTPTLRRNSMEAIKCCCWAAKPS